MDCSLDVLQMRFAANPASLNSFFEKLCGKCVVETEFFEDPESNISISG